MAVLAAAALALAGCGAGSPAPAAGSPSSVVALSSSAASTAGGGAPSSSASADGASGRHLSVSTPEPAQAGSSAGSSAGASIAPGAAAPAQLGRDGPTQRRTFAPTALRLVSGSTTSTTRVDPVDTTSDGELSLPKSPGLVGWWKGGALAGEAYGSVVLAGHIDSRAYGMGFFARLLRARRGDRVTLTSGSLSQDYTIASNRNVAKPTLATGTDTFSQSVPARLVLITCTGQFNEVTHHYDDNLVVLADPVGPVRGG